MRQDRLNSLLPSAHNLSDEEINRGLSGLISTGSNRCYGTCQDDYVESAELHHPSILIQDTRYQELVGLLLMLSSAIGFSLNGLTVKLSGHYFPASFIVLSRSLFQALFAAVACATLRLSPIGPPNKRILLLKRGMYGAIGLALYYYSLTVLPIADATALFFTSPVFTSILAHLWLGESFTRFDKVAALVCISGVILTARPPFLFRDSKSFEDPALPYTQQVLGAAAAVTGAFLSACAYVTVRRIGSDVHFLNHVFSFGVASTLFSSLITFSTSNETKSNILSNLGLNFSTLLLLLVGITAVVGQSLLNRGLQLCRAGPATLMRNVDVVLAYGYGIFIFHEIPNMYSIVGSILIITCTLSMGLKKWFSRS